jgi:hypothetical protein
MLELRKQARPELLAEARKHAITAKLRQVPYPGRPNDNSQDRFLKQAYEALCPSWPSLMASPN